MDEGSGDIAAEPPAKKPKKSRNRHAYKKNGKRAVYMFDVVVDNGLSPVRGMRMWFRGPPPDGAY